jgi:predicted phage tail protein
MATDPNRSDGPSAEAQPPPDLRDVKQDARQTAQALKERARDRLEQGKSGAADQAEAVAEAVDDTAERLRGQNESLAEYGHKISAAVSGMAERLRNSSLDQLAADAQDFARRNPSVFVIGSIAVGVALSRFVKASAQGRDRSPPEKQAQPPQQMSAPPATYAEIQQTPDTAPEREPGQTSH